MPLMGPESRKQLRAVGRVATVGIELVVATMIGLFGGRWLDGVLGTEPWLQWFGLAFGIVAGFLELYRAGRETKRQMEQSDAGNQSNT